MFSSLTYMYFYMHYQICNLIIYMYKSCLSLSPVNFTTIQHNDNKMFLYCNASAVPMSYILIFKSLHKAVYIHTHVLANFIVTYTV